MKLFLLAILIAFSISSQSQIRRIDTMATDSKAVNYSSYKSPKLYSYTVGLQVFSIEEYPKILNQVNSNDLINGTFNGAFVKINDNQISYRMFGTFLSKDLTFRNECEDCEKASGKMRDFALKIGFEKNIVYGVIQPYMAFDIGYRRNSFKGDVSNASALAYTNPYRVSTLKNGFLMSPSIGFKLNLIQHVSLAAETGLGLVYSYEKQEKTYEDANRTRTFNDFKKWEFLLKPLSMLSVQYNFGATY